MEMYLQYQKWILRLLLLTFSYFSLSALAVATTLSFDGTQYMRITMPEESRTEAEDISIRFKTRRSNGLLFATTSTKTADRLELMLEGGQVRLDVNLGSGSKVCTKGVHTPGFAGMQSNVLCRHGSKTMARPGSAIKAYLPATDCVL